MSYQKLRIGISKEKFGIRGCSSILRTFVEGMNEEDITGYNFNRYYDPDSDEIPHLTIRLDLKDDEEGRREMEVIANKLIENNQIQEYSDPEMWEEPPDFVVTAHELSTKVVAELDTNQEFYKLIQDTGKPNRVFEYFVFDLLNQLGFNLSLNWAYRRPFSKFEGKRDRIKSIVKKCVEICPEESQYYSNPSFVERFIHTLFNCSGLGKELVFWNQLFKARTCKNLAKK